ncbi:MAG: SDR family oxidoreductase, partial [Chlamydiota bacterium]|nr:SDR family oxidoreductase [Chlamydiota bacterium]
IYPMDAAFDHPDQVPTSIRENKRYARQTGYTISEVANQIEQEYRNLDVIVHSLANGPEVKSPLLSTSREGYLSAIGASSYSFVSISQRMGKLLPKEGGGSLINLSYLASEKTIPGYGGGMSSAKAALESDTRTLAWEMGRERGARVNSISAGPLGSRAARAIGFIEQMIAYSEANAPLNQSMQAEDVAMAAAFLLSPLARGITGEVLHVDQGLHAMGLASDSPSLNPTKE